MGFMFVKAKTISINGSVYFNKSNLVLLTVLFYILVIKQGSSSKLAVFRFVSVGQCSSLARFRGAVGVKKHGNLKYNQLICFFMLNL